MIPRARGPPFRSVLKSGMTTSHISCFLFVFLGAVHIRSSNKNMGLQSVICNSEVQSTLKNYFSCVCLVAHLEANLPRSVAVRQAHLPGADGKAPSCVSSAWLPHACGDGFGSQRRPSLSGRHGTRGECTCISSKI